MLVPNDGVNRIMNTRNFISLLVALAHLSFAAVATGKTLYVNGSTGSDSVTYANNSATAPWRTLGRAVWGSAQRGTPNSSEAARAGDTVIVAAGVYETSAATNERYLPIYNPINSGTSGNPIVIRAERQGATELRSSQSSGRQPIIGTWEKSHIVWDGFYLDESRIPTEGDTGPVTVWYSTDITIQNLTIRGYNYGWRDNHNGIRLEGVDRIVVRNNDISGYWEEQNNSMNASGITLYDARQVLIENNQVDTANCGIYIKAGIVGPITVRNNLVRNTMNGMIFGRIGTSEASNGLQAYNNIILNSRSGFVFVGYDTISPANVSVVNNTVLSVAEAEGGAVLFRPGYDGYRNLRVFNNILGRSANGVTIWENRLEQVTSEYNVFFNNEYAASVAYSRYSLDNWRSRFGKDTLGSVSVDPRFVSESTGNYRLASDSPVRTAGRDILDLNRNGSTTDSIAIGAYALGNEVIGLTSTASTVTRPNPPESVTAD